MSMEGLVVKRSERCELFANSVRSLIALLIAAKGEVSWSELKRGLKQFVGDINPNTLSFHIGRLMNAGFLKKVGIEGQPRYHIPQDKVSEMEVMIGKDLLEKMKEELSK